MPLTYRRLLPLLALAGLSLTGAAVGMASEPATSASATDDYDDQAPLSAVAQLGKKLFFDPSLSGGGQMSCATCHDPANHYAPANGLAVQLGGLHLDQPGIRAVPSLAYKMSTPSFSIGEESAADEAAEASPMTEASGVALANAPAVTSPLTAQAVVKADAAAANLVPQGGMFWDGRVDSLEEQALQPMISPFEMANADVATVYTKVTKGYGKDISALFGDNILNDQDMTISEIGFALARYQIEDRSFHPYTSKYDYYLRGKAVLTDAEARGLKLFDDANKGNCASCHLDKMTGDGQMPNFTDFEFEALGAPRNPTIPANADAHYFDTGICGPLRSDAYSAQQQNCGLFKTPTLRNVATRHVFFHNGVYRTLEDVTRFYVKRDTNPEEIYPKDASGKVLKYDDLPAQYRANIDVSDAPMNRKPGDAPALNDAEIADIVAFLKTLTDGYDPTKDNVKAAK
ncbi:MULTISPECIES: cytochrome-c peroxidase [Rhizobium]|uniref:C-type cytochrome n=1 Tax=Rhizobium tropici TaxID=398 RepID=A0A6P1CD02_RHITR|nr:MULTISPECIES: cytochrome c peroxidase [Rhizobium]AGB72463.1 di-heme cytochrome c peroxidase family protein [Rhizobium tropici CIAT 899]MBB4243272.1 cytochrome c peroxidase [Rhizobium tropici]MBB5594915.1 cytochrome c peroxidase [Rhizobium tropici]MBB6493598.1 cytochrome c peroxidase [Rhizobium tropici]NEV13593.1 c-type cytochrome [Rhizobium tropici]